MSLRYAKQERLERIGPEGQKTLRDARILIIGGGGLGSAAADALVRAGVGQIIIMDPDAVEIGNLHRTALFDEKDVGRYKAEVLREKLSAVNNDVEIKSVVRRADASVMESFPDVDMVVDGTDNLESRFVINDMCIKHGIPWIYAGVLATGGNVMLIRPEGPCLRCLIPELPAEGTYPVCEETGVFGPLPQIIGRLAASEAIRYLVESRNSLPMGRSSLFIMETWPPSMETVSVPKKDDCPACSLHRFDFLEVP